MPFSIHIDKQKRLIVSTFTGRFTPVELVAARKTLREEPGFDPAFAHIVDLSRVTKLEMESPSVEQLSREKSMFDKDSVQVIVAPEKLKFDFARLFKTKSALERPLLEITRSLEAAYALIALERSRTKT